MQNINYNEEISDVLLFTGTSKHGLTPRDFGVTVYGNKGISFYCATRGQMIETYFPYVDGLEVIAEIQKFIDNLRGAIDANQI